MVAPPAPAHSDQDLADDDADDGADRDRQIVRQRLRVGRERNRREKDRNEDQRHRHIGEHLAHARSARHAERPLGVRVHLPQLQKRREHRHIAQQQHDQVQREEAPEQRRVGRDRLDHHAQQADDRRHHAGGQRRADGHVVFPPALCKDARHVVVFRRVGCRGVHAHRPRDHVAEECHQKQQRHRADEKAARFACHERHRVDQAGIDADLVRRDRCADAERGKQIDRRDDDAAGNDRLRDLALGVAHVVRIGAHDLKAEEVEDDDGDIRQAVQVKRRQERAPGHVVHKTVFDHVVHAQHTDRQRKQHLDGGADVQDDDAVAHRVKRDPRHDPDKHQLNEQLRNHAELHAGDNRQQLWTHDRERRHPQREVDPVIPRGARAPVRLRVRLVDPVVQAAVTRVGRAQLRRDQPVRQQERDDHEQPPEILAVADGRHRRGRLRHEHHADDRQDDVRQPKFFCVHSKNLLF